MKFGQKKAIVDNTENQNNNISHLMANHHAPLESLFLLFKEEAKEKSPRTATTLSELIWETKKHFFTEENAIFDYFPLTSVEILKIINHLKKEHLIMLSDLSEFANNLDKLAGGDIEDFYKLMEGHRHIEEKNLYPKLDQEMRPEQKAEVVLRINQIPIKIKK